MSAGYYYPDASIRRHGIVIGYLWITYSLLMIEENLNIV